MNQRKIQKLRRGLEEEKQNLLHALNRNKQHSQELQTGEDEIDQAVAAQTGELLYQMHEQSQIRLRQINVVLALMDGDEYGVCGQCEEEIPDKRLQALPWATLCVDCQREAEFEGRENGSRTNRYFAPTATNRRIGSARSAPVRGLA